MSNFPTTRRDDIVETLHGYTIADPYRWLEDPDRPDVVDWVERQREYTERALNRLPRREWFRRVLRGIVLRPRAGVVRHLADGFAVSRNDGTRDQDVWYSADTLDELVAGGRVLLDPNTWSGDGTSSLGGFAASPDGVRLCYAVSEAGSDWQRFRFSNLITSEALGEPEVVTKFAPVVWLADSLSILYNAFDHAERAEGTSTAALGGGQLRLHTLGLAPSEDVTVVRLDDERLMAWPQASNDDRWLFVTIERGTESNCRLWAMRQEVVHGRVQIGKPIRLVDEATHEWRVIDAVDDVAYVVTDLDAARSRVVAIDLAASEAQRTLVMREIVPEGDAQIADAVIAGEHLVLETLEDAAPVLRRYRLDGTPVDVPDVPGGAVVGLSGRPGEPDLFVATSSVTSPTTCYRVGPGSGEVDALPLVDAGAPLPEARTCRRRATSADGTEVPYFLIEPVGAPAGPRPTLLYGYGGFRIPVLADFRPIFAGWLAAGGTLAIANLRGGGEFGAHWYEDGKRANKQHVFDDVIAVAEHLIRTGVTTSRQLALHGRSNGGLLVGAAMTQRPELFGVALPMVGVLDLLRFHRFTIGSAWISDYGDPDLPGDFATALAYSPLHNVHEHTAYPPTLIATGDHDDRVVPLHSHKFTAALQHAQAGDAPILTRIESATGHGPGKPATMVADEAADLLAFAAHHTGLSV
ncbi:MAG: prolyl oligopeptidase family serine peptidase [Propionibacterium sp.]|nr:prolyl oligopeptidase family serine peptidase [Propionibacterium sp.]